MKNSVIIVIVSCIMTACGDSSEPQVKDYEKQSVIDSMKMQSELQLTRQRILDSVNLINAQNQVVLSPIETPNVPVKSVHHSHSTKAQTNTNPVTTNNNGTGSTNQSVVNNNTVSATSTPTTEEKKKMSGKTKGAIIGAAAGVITGAAAGAIINKDNPLKGGIIGGVIGGAVGSGVGYGGGNAADQKKAKQDSINKANATKNP